MKEWLTAAVPTDEAESAHADLCTRMNKHTHQHSATCLKTAKSRTELCMKEWLNKRKKFGGKVKVDQHRGALSGTPRKRLPTVRAKCH